MRTMITTLVALTLVVGISSALRWNERPGTVPRTWYYRPQSLESTRMPNGPGTSYATAWTGDPRNVDWGVISEGDTLFVCGVGTGTFVPPDGLANVTIDGACPMDPSMARESPIDQGMWVGGRTVFFNASTWTKLSSGIYSTAVPAGRYGEPIRATAILGKGNTSSVGASTRTVSTHRLIKANCTGEGPTDPQDWPTSSGAFCVAPSNMSDLGDATTTAGTWMVFYRPPTTAGAKSTISVQLDLYETVVTLYNTTNVTLRSLAMVGPAEVGLRLIGDRRLRVTKCSVRWASARGFGINDQQVVNGGLVDAQISHNYFYQTACGIYLVNQENQGQDGSMNTNSSVFSFNKFIDIDTTYFYGNRDSHAIGVQGGRGNVFEHNWIKGAGGSGITLYQGGRQELTDNVIRYNFVSHVHSTNSRENQRGIEFDDDNELSDSTRFGNNSVYYNIVVNVTGTGLRSKAKTLPSPGSNETHLRKLCSWRWVNNLILGAGVGFSIQHQWKADGRHPRHGDCVLNNIFACMAGGRVGSCPRNYAHLTGWLPADVAQYHDTDLHASNLYWPGGNLFCLRVGDPSSCYNLTTLHARSLGRFGNHSLVADPMFSNATMPTLWSLGGLKPDPTSPAVGPGEDVLRAFGDVLRDFGGTLVDMSAPPLGPYVPESK